jgi:hypothetical protein
MTAMGNFTDYNSGGEVCGGELYSLAMAVGLATCVISSSASLLISLFCFGNVTHDVMGGVIHCKSQVLQVCQDICAGSRDRWMGRS